MVWKHWPSWKAGCCSAGSSSRPYGPWGVYAPSAVRSAFDWSSNVRPVSVRSSGGADARLPSADHTASLTSGVTTTFSCASSAAIHSAAQLLSVARSEEHASELPSLMRISYAVFCLKKKITKLNENRQSG